MEILLILFLAPLALALGCLLLKTAGEPIVWLGIIPVGIFLFMLLLYGGG
jgi:hypothetical protein